MSQILVSLFGIILVTLGVIFAYIAYAIFKTDPNEYDRLRGYNPNWKSPFSGRIDTYKEGRRDYTAGAGITYSRKDNKWIDQGIISEEALDGLLNR